MKKYRILFQGVIGDEAVCKTTLIYRFAEAVQGAGGKVTIQESGHFKESRHVDHSLSIASFQDFTMCPECGFKQPKDETCTKCGFRLQP